MAIVHMLIHGLTKCGGGGTQPGGEKSLCAPSSVYNTGMAGHEVSCGLRVRILLRGCNGEQWTKRLMEMAAKQLIKMVKRRLEQCF